MKALPECRPTLTAFIRRERSKPKIRENPKMGIKKRLNPLGIQAFLYEKAKQFRCSSVPLPPANQRSVCRRKSEGIPTIAQFSAKPETALWWEFLSWQRVKDSNYWEYMKWYVIWCNLARKSRYRGTFYPTLINPVQWGYIA